MGIELISQGTSIAENEFLQVSSYNVMAVCHLLLPIESLWSVGYIGIILAFRVIDLIEPPFFSKYCKFSSKYWPGVDCRVMDLIGPL